jgi:hypothetical protein
MPVARFFSANRTANIQSPFRLQKRRISFPTKEWKPSEQEMELPFLEMKPAQLEMERSAS